MQGLSALLGSGKDVRRQSGSAASDSTEAVRLDINRCGEEDFLKLPGMSLISAKRAVELRENQGDYQSIDDFVERNQIKPHFMVQMEPMITVAGRKQEEHSHSPRKGRALDL